jgi:hypothetical protein
MVAGNNFNAVNTANNGRPRGRANYHQMRFRDLVRHRTPAAVARMVQLSMQNDDLRVAFDATRELIYWGHGKPREHSVVEQNDIADVIYPTLEELRAQLIAEGLPLDRLEQPEADRA